MSRNGSGTYTLPTGNPVISGTVIRSSWANTTMSDVATALTQSLASDGQTAPTANLPMAGFKHTGVGLAAALTDYARASQAQSGSMLLCSAAAMPSADVYTGSLPFGATSFGVGQIITYTFTNANVGTTPTLNINSSSAWPILREDGSPVQAGDCKTGIPSQLMWSGVAWLLLGTAGAGGGSGVTAFNSRMGAVTLLSADVTTALGYTPFNTAGGTFGGPVVLSGNAATSLQPTTLQQVQAMIAAIPGGTGVTSFNTRTGAVTLTGTDVTNALGFSPLLSFNTRTGAVTLTSGDVTGALTYTPINKAGDTFTGTINGLDASFKRYIRNGATQTGGATLDFSVNDTLIISYGASYTINAVSGLPADGDEGVVVFKSTSGGDITWNSSVFKWDRDSNASTPYTEVHFNAGPQNVAIVRVRRYNSLYYVYAKLF